MFIIDVISENTIMGNQFILEHTVNFYTSTMERLPPPQVPGLPPMSALGISGINEKLYAIGEHGQKYCFKSCVGYFSEDSIPYHYGEKTCYERCLSKLHEGFELSKRTRKTLEEKAKLGEYVPSWISRMPSA